ncbi:efflux RND transporter periplasmic adaptor subunit [Sphingomonas sp. JC676]|uniref:efflux RND transporter periplasmic adaptor subunit n=1 Tax=Sphingomonas sp. JC676 TaxID=2768065 RepID=UPI001657DC28|nr:efflux RND transporter periplasmic adaptor subunit [Sphingomonas sp. JC676]MBC9034133.1 efflux RND transporter periplasmic adaptor subunit [Sphingomonas sp. JC676]
MATDPNQNLSDFLGTPPRPWWRRYLKWALIGIGVVLLALLGWHFLGSSAAVRYATDDVQRGNLTVTVSATGKLAPTNQVTVGSQLSGQVIKVLVDVNDRVTAGQTLALIDPSQFDDQVKQAQAALAADVAAVGQAQATLQQNNATLARYQQVSRLSGGKVPAKTEMDVAIGDRNRALANLNAANANVVSARAQLSSAQTQRTRAVIRSPVTGVILARQIDPGQTVAASFNTPTLFVIAQDLSQMKLEVAIDEADVGQVKQGQDATFTVDAFPGKTFPAKITRVEVGSNLSVQDASSATSTASTTANQVVSYAADLSVSNANEQLRPGMTATADIVTMSRQNVLLVPNAALRFTPAAAGGSQASGAQGGIAGALVPTRRRGGGGGAAKSATMSKGAEQTVYILGADGKPQAVQVTTGDTDGTVTEVTGGQLKPGDKVITGQLATGSSSGQRRQRRQGAGAGGQGGAGGAAGGGQRGGQ